MNFSKIIGLLAAVVFTVGAWRQFGWPGLALATGLAPWLWRLAFVLFTFFGGAGLLVYLLLWIFVPAEPSLNAVPRQLGS